MEAVAAISSIAGILSLIGQSLDGIVKLRGFFQDCADASVSIRRFLTALNGLIQILEDVRDLMGKLEGTWTGDPNRSIIASLQIQIDDCSKDVYVWVEKARACHGGMGKGTRASFERFLVALEKKRIVDIYQEIANHRDNITTKLTIIGRYLDIGQSIALGKISSKMDEVAESHNAAKEALEKLEATKEALEKLEASSVYSSGNAYDIQRGPASLASIASSLSRIENALSSRHGSSGSDCCVRLSSPHNPVVENSSYALPNELYNSSDAPEWLGQFEPNLTAEFDDQVPVRPHNWVHYDFVNPLPCPEMNFGNFDMGFQQNGFQPTYWPQQAPNYPPPHVRPPSPSSAATNAAITLPETVPAHPKESEDRRLPNATASFINFSNTIVKKSSSCPLPQLDDYVHLIHLRSMIKTWIDGMTAIPWLYSERRQGDRISDDINLREHLSKIEADIEKFRCICWQSGENVDDIEVLFKMKDAYGLSTPLQPKQEHATEPDDGFPEFEQGLEQYETKLGASKKDQINLWLLDNLRASQTEASRHRSYLIAPDSLNDQEWARAVLKYWLLDDAAACSSVQAASSNGAVNSAGRCHSTRVVFENHLPFPIVDIQIEEIPPSTTAMEFEKLPGLAPGVLKLRRRMSSSEQDASFLDGVDDAMSFTSMLSEGSLAHRQKKRKREHIL